MLAGVAALVGVAAFAAPALRTPEEQVEARVSSALSDAGVELDSPVDLETGGGASAVYSGRLRVLADDGGVARVRISIRPDSTASAQLPAEWLFPAVDCDAAFPLTWLRDSDSSYRTTRADLAECISQDVDGGLLVTIARSETASAADTAAARQTWRIDARGGIVWLNNTDGGPGAAGGLSVEQQRAVAQATRLLDVVRGAG